MSTTVALTRSSRVAHGGQTEGTHAEPRATARAADAEDQCSRATSERPAARPATRCLIRAQAKRVGDTEAASRQQVQAQLVRQPEASGSNRTSELIGRLFAQTAKVGA